LAKQKYQVGDRVRVIDFDGPYSGMRKLTGTIVDLPIEEPPLFKVFEQVSAPDLAWHYSVELDSSEGWVRPPAFIEESWLEPIVE